MGQRLPIALVTGNGLVQLCEDTASSSAGLRRRQNSGSMAGMKIPPDNWIDSFGHRLGVDFKKVRPGLAEAALKILPTHCNPNGVCHGGVLFTFADETMGAAAHALCPPGFVPTSTQVNIHYARSVRAGETLRVETQGLSHGRRTALLESRITNETHRLVALVTASFLFVEPRP